MEAKQPVWLEIEPDLICPHAKLQLNLGVRRFYHEFEVILQKERESEKEQVIFEDDGDGVSLIDTR